MRECRAPGRCHWPERRVTGVNLDPRFSSHSSPPTSRVRTPGHRGEGSRVASQPPGHSLPERRGAAGDRRHPTDPALRIDRAEPSPIRPTVAVRGSEGRGRCSRSRRPSGGGGRQPSSVDVPRARFGPLRSSRSILRSLGP